MKNELIDISIKPNVVGYYPTLYCWNIQDEVPSGCYWNGERFETYLPIYVYIDKVFDSELDAETYMYDYLE